MWIKCLAQEHNTWCLWGLNPLSLELMYSFRLNVDKFQSIDSILQKNNFIVITLSIKDLGTRLLTFFFLLFNSAEDKKSPADK